MKTTKRYNRFSENAELPTLKPGERAVFEVDGIRTDPTQKDKLLIPAAVNVPSQDVVLEPKSGETVEIASIQSVSPMGDPRFRDIWFHDYNAGKIVLDGNRMADRELYTYLKMTNYNGSNPNRDPSFPKIFHEVNKAAQAKAKRTRRNASIDAVNKAREMSSQAVEEFAIAMGQDANQDIEALRQVVEDFAWSNPTKFNTLLNSDSVQIKAILRSAESQGHILFNLANNQWRWSGSNDVILTVSRTSGSSPMDELTDYVMESDKGAAVLKQVQKLLNGKSEGGDSNDSGDSGKNEGNKNTGNRRRRRRNTDHTTPSGDAASE